jgi:hypothetical protein
MRSPRILDVLAAVARVASEHPEVHVWWYVPTVSRSVRDTSAQGHGPVPVELVLQGDGRATPDCDRIAAALVDRLGGYPVSVRLHRGAAEGRRLYRLADRDVVGAEAVR